MSLTTFEEKVEEIGKTRKFYELSLLLIENAGHENIIKYAVEYLPKMHHLTVAEVVEAIILKSNKNLNEIKDLVLFALEIVKKDNQNSIIVIQLAYILYLIKINSIEEIESKILEYLDTPQLTLENKLKVNYAAYKFYEKLENWDNAIDFALQSNLDLIDINLICIYAVISNNFYDFAKIKALNKFDMVKESLKVFINELLGGVFVTTKELQLPTCIPNKYYDLVKEKVFLIEIVNICRRNLTSKFVKFEEFMSTFNFPNTNSLVCLLIKALGKGLVKGWIDSEIEMFYFDTIIPQELAKKDVIDLRQKFVNMRNRVHDVIEMLQNFN